MRPFCLVLFVVCLDVGACWFFELEEETQSENGLTKRHVNRQRRSSPKDIASTLNKMDHLKRETDRWMNPNIETAISMTSVRSTGVLSDNTVVLTVSSLYTLDLIWSLWSVGNHRTISRGDVRKDDIIVSTDITLTREELDHIELLQLYINSPEYVIVLTFELSNIIRWYAEESVVVSGQLFGGPFYPNRMLNNSVYEFSLRTQREMKSPSDEFIFFFTYFDPEQPGNAFKLDRIRDIEYDVLFRETWVKAHLGESKPGELLYAYLRNINKFGMNTEIGMFNMSAFRYINIPRYQPVGSSELMFFEFKQDVQRFPSTIRYGSLQCMVIGTAEPILEIRKDGEVLDVQQFTGLGRNTYVLVSFDGKSLDEVSGTYVCKATYGNTEIVQEILVEGLPKTDNN